MVKNDEVSQKNIISLKRELERQRNLPNSVYICLNLPGYLFTYLFLSVTKQRLIQNIKTRGVLALRHKECVEGNEVVTRKRSLLRKPKNYEKWIITSGNIDHVSNLLDGYIASAVDTDLVLAAAEDGMLVLERKKRDNNHDQIWRFVNMPRYCMIVNEKYPNLSMGSSKSKAGKRVVYLSEEERSEKSTRYVMYSINLLDGRYFQRKRGIFIDQVILKERQQVHIAIRKSNRRVLEVSVS